MALGRDAFHPWAALAALVGALLIQIGTNFANDYFDFVKGADTAERVGPRRATQAGLVTPAAMRSAFLLTFALAIAVGTYLVARAGWPIVAIGLVSVACGILYTGGPFPLGYLGLGDLFVWVFFGPVAVGGTVFVQALEVTRADLVIGVAFGALATAILVVNNLRDTDTDVVAGKRTLAVRLGKPFARFEYLACLAIALGTPFAFVTERPWLWLVVVLVPWAVQLTRLVVALDGAALNPLLGATGKFLVAYAVVFSIGWLA